MARLWPNGSTAIPRVTSEFGPRKAPTPGASTMHQGIDLVGFTYNCASQAGTVVAASYNGGSGNEVRVQHADGSVTRYLHNASFLVRDGQAVSAGQRLGVMGRTGNVTGVHCHFGTQNTLGGAFVNPRAYVAGGAGTAGGTGGSGNSIINLRLGIQYVTMLQRELGVDADGDAGQVTIKALQRKIGTPDDGDFGPNSVKALQRFVGLSDVDGDWGDNTTRAVRAAIDASKFGIIPGPAAPPAGTELTGVALERAKGMKAELGAEYVAELQKQLGITPDGFIGRGTVETLQRKVGATPDGDFGPASISKLQTFIGFTGADVDGVWGVGTTAGVKNAIHIARFTPGWTPPVVVPPVVVPPVVVPPVVADVVRTAKDLPVNRRATPSTATPSIPPEVAAGAVVKIKSYAKGQAVSGNDVWFRLEDGTFAWSGGFVSSSTDGLTLEVVDVPPAPVLPAGAVYGIDVAWPQTGVFDWPTVKAGNEFVIIKAAGAEDGLYGPATLTDKHLAGARSVGARVGFYFFNNGLVNVKTQADKFIEVLKPRILPGDIVALDIENDGITVPQFSPAQALEFADYVWEALGVKTFMYINRATMNTQDWSAVVAAGHPLWLAVLSGLGASIAAPIKHWDRADIVQFEVGRINGYPGDIDRNYGFEQSLIEYGFLAFPGEEPEEPEVPSDEVRVLRARVAALEAKIAKASAALAE
jgi:GH25 family lysozyme M1 (1,4-beta-N-acetylmuramidase)